MPDEHPSIPQSPVLILGGGIHGAAVARELILNGFSVILIDTSDLATGATSKSSRLIHGGLRYLEYGDLHLVHESLAERGRLLKLAPQFVRPLKLVVPMQNRWSGLLRSALGFFKLARTRLGRRIMGRSERRALRGYWPVRLGLWMYDLFSLGDGLPKSRGSSVSSNRGPHVDSHQYRWTCEYYDAQMRYPERCVIALLAEARQVAKDQGLSFQVIPYAKFDCQGSTIEITGPDGAPLAIQPELIINTSGAWGDLTLNRLDATTTPLFAGTKGSHMITRHPGLKTALGDQGVYAETSDRRLAFILPFGDSVLVGTTDEKWSGPPGQAVASDEELVYLLSVVNGVFGLTLSRSDVESHYSGVRPLPRTTDTTNAAISRDHSLVEHRLRGVTIITLVGGKLTTFRRVAESIVDQVLQIIHRPRRVSTTDRMIFGGEDFPQDPATWNELFRRWAMEFASTEDEVAALWPLYGMQTRSILAEVASQSTEPVADTPFLCRTVCWIIRNEWVTTLDDLIERRLLLVFAERLTLAMLRDLASCLVETGTISSESMVAMIETTRVHLRIHYGRQIGE